MPEMTPVAECTEAAHRTDVTGRAIVNARTGTALVTVLSLGASFLATPVIDYGTRVVDRLDYSSTMRGTALAPIRVEGPVVPFQTPTRMARIRALAPLSLRDWAEVFGVSHSAVKQWIDGDEPAREKLDLVLDALNAASAHHANLATWLTVSLPGMEVRPLDLLRDERWRAFRGAIRARSAPTPSIAINELLRRRRAEVSWGVPEPAVTVDDQA
jgi:hypothetical protein